MRCIESLFFYCRHLSRILHIFSKSNFKTSSFSTTYYLKDRKQIALIKQILNVPFNRFVALKFEARVVRSSAFESADLVLQCWFLIFLNLTSFPVIHQFSRKKRHAIFQIYLNNSKTTRMKKYQITITIVAPSLLHLLQ